MYNHSGINCLGADSVICVENNTIQENTGPGIKIGIANKS